MEDQNLLQLIIPHKHRPGTDLMTKLILQDSRIMNIILKALIGQHAENHYISTPCEWIDGRHADILYTPIISPTNALPPIIIEVQHTVDKPFIRRLIKYCGHITEKYLVEPIALTICIHAVRKEISSMLLETSKAPYLKKLPSDCWAQEHFFMSEATILDFFQAPIPPIVALGYVLVKQEVSLLSLEYRDDPTVQLLYAIAKATLEHEVHDEEKTVEVLMNVCKHNHDQYKRILQAIEDDGADPKRVKMYADDGLLYSEICIRKYSQQPSTSSMPDPLELPQTIQASSSKSTTNSPLRTIDPEAKKTDMEWVKEFVQKYKEAKKRMDWQACFTMGREAGYFKTYANAQSLKNTFNSLKSKQ